VGRGSTFTVQAEDAAGLTITAPLSISVVPTDVTSSLAWTETALPGGTVGTGYIDGVSAAGTGTITYSLAAGTLPPGLTLGSATGSVTVSSSPHALTARRVATARAAREVRRGVVRMVSMMPV